VSYRLVDIFSLADYDAITHQPDTGWLLTILIGGAHAVGFEEESEVGGVSSDFFPL
jgi:hypothetical protein